MTSAREAAGADMTPVRELMSTHLVTAHAGNSVQEAAAKMFRHRVGAVLVMHEGKLMGIFTERDVLRALRQDSPDRGRIAPIERWMTADPLTVLPETTAKEALTLMLEVGFRHLPVVYGSDVVGMVSMRDLLPSSLASERS